MSYACVTHTTTIAVTFLPLLVIHFIILNWLGRRRPLLTAALEFFAGGVTITVILGLINQLTGGSFLFFLPQINYALRLSQHGNAWYVPLSTWIKQAYWLVLPAITIVAIPLFSLRNLFKSHLDEKQLTIVIGSYLQFLLILGIFVYFSEVKQQTTLYPKYMFHLAIAPMMMALASLLFSATPKLNLLSDQTLILGSLLTYLLPWFMIPAGIKTEVFNWLISHSGSTISQWPILIPFLIGMIGFISLWMFSRWKYAIFVTLAFLSTSLSLQTNPPDFSWRNSCSINRDMFNAVIEADRFLTSLDKTLANTKYWFKQQEVQETTNGCPSIPLGRVFDSLTSTRGWCGNMLSGCGIANREIINDNILNQTPKIGILSGLKNKDQNIADMQERLKKLGKVMTPLGEKLIESGPLKFAINVFEVGVTFPQTVLQQALQYHQAGNLPVAEDLYRQILQVEPNNPQALHYLGVIAAQVKRYDAAIKLMKQALVINPTAPLYYSNLAGALLEQGQLGEAIACYQRALTLDPQNAGTRQLLDKAQILRNQRVLEGNEKESEVIEESSPCRQR